MSYKDRTNDGLIKIYKDKGLPTAIEVAKYSMKSRKCKSDQEFSSIFSGELCETVLEIFIMDFIKKYPVECKDWVVAKGLILNDKDNEESDFLTEIDLILATPQRLYVIECKAYRGKKVLNDVCSLVTEKGKVLDVYKQNTMHAKVLMKQFVKFRTTRKGKDLQLVMFDFSLGTTTDKRNRTSKNVMLYCNEHNIMKVLENWKNDKTGTKWDMRYVKKALHIIEKGSPALRQKHIEYVKSIHEKE